MRISDWSSDVCSSDLLVPLDFATAHIAGTNRVSMTRIKFWRVTEIDAECVFPSGGINCIADAKVWALFIRPGHPRVSGQHWAMLGRRSEEHTSELQSLMRTSYAVFCLKTKQRTHPKQISTSMTRQNN